MSDGLIVWILLQLSFGQEDFFGATLKKSRRVRRLSSFYLLSPRYCCICGLGGGRVPSDPWGWRRLDLLMRISKTKSFCSDPPCPWGDSCRKRGWARLIVAMGDRSWAWPGSDQTCFEEKERFQWNPLSGPSRPRYKNNQYLQRPLECPSVHCQIRSSWGRLAKGIL